MSKFANNPQSFINGYISGVRNIFLLTTVGVGMYGFSKSFKNKNSESLMRLFSCTIYIFALLYLNKIENSSEKNNLPDYIDLKHWRYYEYLTWMYSIFLSIIIILALKRFVKILFGIKQ